MVNVPLSLGRGAGDEVKQKRLAGIAASLFKKSYGLAKT